MRKVLFALVLIGLSSFAKADPGDVGPVTVINTIRPKVPGAFPVNISTDVWVSTQSFSKNLSSADYNLQHALNTIDQFTLGGGSLTPGSTNYIWNSNNLQSGATFYVSSGTVQGQLTANQNLSISVVSTASINQVSVYSKKATLWTTSAHGFKLGRVVRITGLSNSVLNTTATITGVPTTTTFNIVSTSVDISTVADSGLAESYSGTSVNYKAVDSAGMFSVQITPYANNVGSVSAETTPLYGDYPIEIKNAEVGSYTTNSYSVNPWLGYTFTNTSNSNIARIAARASYTNYPAYDVAAIDLTNNVNGTIGFYVGGNFNGATLTKAAQFNGDGTLSLYKPLRLTDSTNQNAQFGYTNNLDSTASVFMASNVNKGLVLQTPQYHGTNTFELQQGGGNTVIGGISNQGNWWMGGASGSSTSRLVVSPRQTSDVGLTVKGIASQSGNLQEWQNSSGVVLASVTANGTISGVANLSSATISGQLSSGNGAGTSGQILQSNGPGVAPSWINNTGGGGGGMTSGSTMYIQNSNTLQSGSTFYVSSGTVNGQFNLNDPAGSIYPLTFNEATPLSGWGKGPVLFHQGKTQFTQEQFSILISTYSYSEPLTNATGISLISPSVTNQPYEVDLYAKGINTSRYRSDQIIHNVPVHLQDRLYLDSYALPTSNSLTFSNTNYVTTTLTVSPVPGVGSTNLNFILPTSSGTSGQFIQTDGNGNLSFANATASPAGSNGQIQYNNNGTLAGHFYSSFSATGSLFNIWGTTFNVTELTLAPGSITQTNPVFLVKNSAGTDGFYVSPSGSFYSSSGGSIGGTLYAHGNCYFYGSQNYYYGAVSFGSVSGDKIQIGGSPGYLGPALKIYTNNPKPFSIYGITGTDENLMFGQWSSSATITATNDTDNRYKALDLQGGPIHLNYNLPGNVFNGVAVGNIATPLATLHAYSILPGTTTVIVQGAASQTANLQEWRNSSGVVLSSVTASGVISGSHRLIGHSMSWFNLNAPVSAASGEMYYCDDCANYAVAISTGGSVGQWGVPSSKTTFPN